MKPVFTKKQLIKPLIFLLLLSSLFACNKEKETLFLKLAPESTGIDFANIIQETDSFNIITEEFIFNGAGVGVGDFNNDGLPDLFFSGNEVNNKLYLNEGSMKFRDVTDISGMAAADRWSTGVAVVDINEDGWMDIYVTSAIKKDSLERANMLFVNQGLDNNGIPIFKEMAASYGLNDMGYSMSATFFDYNNDGHLDLYVLNNILVTALPGVFRDKITDGSAGNNDRLYRNNGDGTFTDVTLEAGIKLEGYGLGLAISDFNADGWSDIYISNDYLSNDILYLNNGDGTFTNQIEEYIRHQSHFSMGVDIADINNDGLQDIVTLDMLAESNFRMKTTISQNTYQKYINNEKWGYQYQYIRNMLHLNNGHGLPFSEIGFMAGIHQTDWSWSPLLVDVDNDGHRDLLVTNGYPRDITDKDFTNFRNDMGNTASTEKLLNAIPVVKIPNYGFKNNGDLTFSGESENWGLDIPSFSNGAAYVDLDQDGDLDYVVNNINQEAFIFENQLNNRPSEKTPHYLRVKLTGTAQNPSGIGAKIKLTFADGSILYNEQYIGRGYMSSVEDLVHFGLGDKDQIASLEVLWPDQRLETIENPAVNQVITVDIRQAKAIDPKALAFPFAASKKNPILEEISQQSGPLYKHQERDKIDFNLQRTLPHKLSQFGPGMAVGDINGNGQEDLIIGGAAGYNRKAFLQSDATYFELKPSFNPEENLAEDMGLSLFDMDNDGDLDLYVVSGSNEYAVGEAVYQDMLYINDGEGNFKLLENALPEMHVSGTVVRAADMDADGFLDLFVGGRSAQGQYPLPGECFLLKNTGNGFIDVTDDLAPGLKDIGMVTDALWTDIDNDGLIDLMVVGEFMNIEVFKHTGNSLQKIEGSGLENHTGWWNSIIAGDFDRDGDTDYVVGNLGKNNFYGVSPSKPLTLYAKDFDKNQSIDPVLFAYFKDQKGTFKPFPVHFWNDLYGQSPIFRKRFSNFKDYGNSGLDEVFEPEELEDAIKLEANWMESSYIENLKGGKFRVQELPIQAQIAPINGMVPTDVDRDGNLDILLVGNNYGNEVFAGRYDASVGLWLKGSGSGQFEVKSAVESGFIVPRDAKALVKITRESGVPLYVSSQNRDSLRVFTHHDTSLNWPVFAPAPQDSYMFMYSEKGLVGKHEFYYGSGFLSQSSRKVALPEEVNRLEVFDFKGNKRIIDREYF
ncbi:VCBS repeat-containing protein [Cyclobacterium sp. 1_MG-2023]|uniref:VCBS repeat-containing protein n=1 Tax=Cyclobacterium sp. 1_MG-2023 TaxID=3062681 RepID=UPI0026E1ABF6|nr:VCBS repeat-containing protein [Cyclobacterium sp. 1_MG-2023]MDO6440301.1 VCBS repeat-containing protein [Cyclobacterium sp. 1_MG-2023]